MAAAQKTKEKDEQKTKEKDEQQKPTEDEAGDKQEDKKDLLPALDACLTSSTLHVGLGFLGGFLGSIVVRRRWPIVLGLGFGVGQSIGCCREDFEGDDEEEKKKNEKDPEEEETKDKPKEADKNKK